MMQGLGLMVIGMGVVFAFLGLLVFMMDTMAKVLAPYVDEELHSKPKSMSKPVARPAAQPKAAIAAAAATQQAASGDDAAAAVAVAAAFAQAQA